VALLFGGAAAAFLAVAVATLTARAIVAERRQAYRALQTLRAVELRPADLHDRELARPARERLLRPLAGAALAVARRCTPVGVRERIRRRLVMAGSSAGWDADRVLAAKVGGLGLGLGLGAGLAAAGLVPAWPLRLLLPAACCALGFEAPTIVLANAVQRRQARLRRALPDSIDLLTISVEAGLGFDSALAQVAASTSGPLADELQRTLREMQLGRSRAEAMRNLADRCGVPELSAFVLAMIQADVFGVPVAGVLRVQARDQRTKRRQLAEERAMKVPIKVLFPVLFCIFPALFVVILGPAAMRLASIFGR
jgi:tight adherence protein C